MYKHISNKCYFVFFLTVLTGCHNIVYLADVNLGILYCSARKLSYRLATEDAFSKVVLAVLPNGKVYADVLEPVLNNNLNFLRVKFKLIFFSIELFSDKMHLNVRNYFNSYAQLAAVKFVGIIL